MSRNQDLATLLRARTPLLLVESADENGVVEGFRHAIAQALRPLWRWSITGGLERLDLDLDFGDETTGEAPDASLSLQAIKRATDPGVYLLLDFQPYLRYPMTLRLLREIVQRQDVTVTFTEPVPDGSLKESVLGPPIPSMLYRIEPNAPDMGQSH